MSRFLMCEYGAARMLREAPAGTEYVGTVAVGEWERYRVLRLNRELFAVPATVLRERQIP